MTKPPGVPREWACPVCGGHDASEAFVLPDGGTEGGVAPEAFRPSSSAYGTTVGRVLRCRQCGHGAVAELPGRDAMGAAYADAADPVSLREEAGQVETARRALERIERFVAVGRVADIGCWTGSFLAAAVERGWEATGIEPSRWASERARARGLDVGTAELAAHGLAPTSFRLVVLADVLEHLGDPGGTVDIAASLLEPGGSLYITVPDAGSGLARLLRRRWWSVLPMHVQYFTRASLTRLLTVHGFEVRFLRTHAKVFTVRYYAERLDGYSPRLARAANRMAERAGQADRLVAPDLRDRLQVLAVRRAV